jgi:hypothetical protein
MTACSFAFGTVVSGCVIYSVGFGAGCSDVSFFGMHFDHPNKEH